MAKKGVLFLSFVAVASLIVNITIYYWADIAGLADNQGFLTYSNLMIISWSTIAAICFFFAMGSFGVKSTQGQVWLFMALGQVLYAIGDIIYFQLSVFGPDANPFPSLADIFWTLAYPLIFVGMTLQLRLASAKLTWTEIGIVLTITGIGAVATWFYILSPTIATWTSSTAAAEILFSLDYPIFDIILAPLAIFLALKYRGGQFARAWFIIAAGFVLMAAFDLAYTYFTSTTGGYLFLYTDHIYIGQYMILSLGALYLAESVRGLK